MYSSNPGGDSSKHTGYPHLFSIIKNGALSIVFSKIDYFLTTKSRFFSTYYFVKQIRIFHITMVTHPKQEVEYMVSCATPVIHVWWF